jgi:hypothetical protein
MSEWVRLCGRQELPAEAEAKEFSVQGHTLCVATLKGTPLALYNVCPVLWPKARLSTERLSVPGTSGNSIWRPVKPRIRRPPKPPAIRYVSRVTMFWWNSRKYISPEVLPRVLSLFLQSRRSGISPASTPDRSSCRAED